MPSKRNRYSRARIRSKAVRRTRRRGSSHWFYSAIALVVIAGIAGIALARQDTSAAGEPPQPGDPATGAAGDHWHEAIGVNICGTWISAPPTFETISGNDNVRAGIHTHGDGFIHIHPFTRSEGGSHATLGRFLDYGGWSASDTSLKLWPDQTSVAAGAASSPVPVDVANGDKCPVGSPFAGQKGVVKWSVDCKDSRGDPSSLRLKDLAVVALAFVPKDQAIGVPPNATATPTDDGTNPTALNIASCATAGPGAATPTTTAASTPTTTAAATTATTATK
jgi:hypothetical protein